MSSFNILAFIVSDALDREPICLFTSGVKALTSAFNCSCDSKGNCTAALAFKLTSLRETKEAGQSKIDSARSKNRNRENVDRNGRSLCAFFLMDRLGYPSNFAFSRTSSNHAELCCRHVRSTSKGVVAFPTLPDTNAFAFHLHEAALRTLVSSFEPFNDFQIPFSNGGTIACPETASGANLFCSSQLFSPLELLAQFCRFFSCKLRCFY